MSAALLKADTHIETPSLSHLSAEDYEQVYEPAEDSFLLLDALEDDLALLRKQKISLCLEIGCGSGIISTAVASALGSGAFCIALDLNPAACHTTLKTAQENGVLVDVMTADLTGPLVEYGLVDLLLFNPPYVPTPPVELENPDTPLTLAWAGGERGREVIDRLLPKVSALLAPNGLFYLVVIATNGVEEIAANMASHGFHYHLVRERKVRGEHLMILRFERKTKIIEHS